MDPDNSDRNVEYFIRYQANDICTDPLHNIRRMKSNGFFVTKASKIALKDLIPYTTYNLTLSTMLHQTEKHMTVNTKESPYISLEEQPNRIKIEELTDTKLKVSWDKVDCRNTYGRIIYSLELLDIKSGNVTDLGEQTDRLRVINGLRPYTNYSLQIGTSRSIIKSRRGRKLTTKMVFTTKPGLASPPRNLEIYASSSHSLSLRYNLPDEREGHPIELHITRCNPITLKKCKMLQQPVMPCKIYAGKYCVDVPNLIPYQRQLIKFSLKNEGSHTFGEETTIEGFTQDRAPGQPTNVSYKLTDCEPSAESCNLNISWIHPYDQSGIITSFNIVLNSSEENINETKSFMKVYEVENENYQAMYTYQIQQVPFSKQYNLYIQSVNELFKSPYTTQTVVHIVDLGDLIDQSPIILKTSEDFIEFELKPPDQRISTTLTVIVQDFNESKTIDEKISRQIELADNLCNDFGETWISQIFKIDNSKRRIKVGNSDSSGKSLKPETKYCITFLMENEYQNSSDQNVYYETVTTLAHTEESQSNGLNIYLIILIIFVVLVIVIGALLMCYFKKRKNSRRPTATSIDENEHAYESLPFEDTFVNNNMYDHLEHK
ncbi:hypothetical protein HHI36_002089 [Cryptolaemus montrouzieri]|uniref:Fibronectin type-III domain-containing protein n=1 Tax=Cryptolaemus montrouzieri TaxID=559131 RepID=A0ABD2P9Y7_9CUCU